MKFTKENLLLYAVTDRTWAGESPLYRQIEAALKGGVTLVQLREKKLEERAFLEEALDVKDLCHSYQVPLIINDNVEVAKKSGADGVHVGITDAPVAEIRQEMGEDFIIGATAKTVEQAKAAEAAGADYLGVGAVFPSPTKTDAIRITKEQLREIRESVKIPVVAIGGIGYDNMEELAGSGADGVAVVSALFAQDNIEEAAYALKKRAKQVLEK